MKFSLATIAVGFTSLVAAIPQARPASYPSSSYPSSSSYSYPAAPSKAPVYCLTNDTATTLVNGFASLLTNYKDSVADALLASDFTDTSDSINQLAGYPLGSVTFPSKAAFKAGQGSQQPIGFTVLSIDEVTCTGVAFRWIANLGNPNLKPKGINSFVASNLNATTEGWQIKTMYSEFNTCTWTLALGGKCGFS